MPIITHPELFSPSLSSMASVNSLGNGPYPPPPSTLAHPTSTGLHQGRDGAQDPKSPGRV